MHKSIEFTNMECLNPAYIIKKYKGKTATTIEGLQDLINGIREDIHNSGYAPRYNLTATYFTDKGTDNCTEVSINIKTSSKSKYHNPLLKASFVLANDENFCENLIKEIATWVDSYNLNGYYMDNLAEFQKLFDNAVEIGEIPFSVKFQLGSGIIDADDNSIVLGVAPDVIRGLAGSSMFLMEGFYKDYVNGLADVLKTCARPIDIIKLNSNKLKVFGIYSRKSLKKLLRKEVATRRIAYTRIGVGYYECDDYFAVIKKSCVTAEEAEKAVSEGKYVIDNVNATKVEKNNNLTKVIIEYKVSPFCGTENVDVDIKTIPGIVDANKE